MSTSPQDPAPAPPPPADRARLQKLFEHANRTAEQAVKQGVKTNFDYANDLYAQCVVGDPGNLEYAKRLMDNLYHKFGEGKKGSKFSWGGGGGAIKKLVAKKDWPGVIKSGLATLKTAPWDATALLSMAEACEHMKCYDTQLLYLKGAWVGNSKSVDVNRTCAFALERRGRFDEAIECWRRVILVKPQDEEAEKMTAKLMVAKTIKQGKYDEAESTTDTMKDKHAQAERRGEAERVTPEQKFRKLIEEKPEDVSNYVELADLVAGQDRHAEALQILEKGLQVSGGDLKFRELYEDAQIRHARHNVRIAEQRNAGDQSEVAKALVQQLMADLNRLELDVFGRRCERYPTNTGLKYEMGLRLRRAGNYNEAIKYLQQARNDPKRRGVANFELGECFRLIKQYPLAVGAYEAAVEGLSGRDDEPRKLALYWAGKVALLGTKDLDKASKHLNELAGIDFGFRDLSVVLDKLNQMRQDT